ncbi:MAG TPA: hypothetical protein VK997_03865 [Deferrisomatales bacterium]|nr:hypothetical protein [Deferrisomatales bacterium]
MDTRERLCEEIARFVQQHPDNRRERGEGRYFGEPLVGFAAADDPLFAAYQTIIGAFHRTPGEWLAEAGGEPAPRAGTVVCWVLPITVEVRKSTRHQEEFPSRQWAHTRDFGEAFNRGLRARVVEFLVEQGGRAVAPMLAASWQRVVDPVVGLASTWSERHAAYAAGLGTFSLNDGLITPRGIAHRVGTVVTDLVLEPSPRPYTGYRENCLTCRGEECGACIRRCPAAAITLAGHDKDRCQQYTYETVLRTKGEEYGVSITGCGLCQTGVPCESRIPTGTGGQRTR